MFSMREFVKHGYLDAVGKQPDFWVVLNAAGWAEKGVLTESDLEEIQNAIDEHNAREAEAARAAEAAKETENIAIDEEGYEENETPDKGENETPEETDEEENDEVVTETPKMPDIPETE